MSIGGNPGQATIENIELGRKASIDVIQLLNIAMALRVPLTYLLVPIGSPDEMVELPGLSADFDSMTVAEFDAWLAGTVDGARRATSLEERSAAVELEALRLWLAQRSEVARLEAVVELEMSTDLDARTADSTRVRLASARREADQHRELLRNAGWPV